MKSVSLVFLLILAETACTRLSVPRAASAVPPTPVLQPEEANDETDRGEVEDDGHATEFYLKRRVAPGETTLSLDRYIAAREHSRQMPTVSLAAMSRNETAKLSGGSWTSLGPGNVGGRTRSLVINPQNPNIMYAGAVTGGVWKTTDGGNSWTALTDMLPVLNIGALVMDPNDSNTLYAGTGEYYKAFPGQGIFKTSDGGATWNLLTHNGHQCHQRFRVRQSPGDEPDDPEPAVRGHLVGSVHERGRRKHMGLRPAEPRPITDARTWRSEPIRPPIICMHPAPEGRSRIRTPSGEIPAPPVGAPGPRFTRHSTWAELRSRSRRLSNPRFMRWPPA